MEIPKKFTSEQIKQIKNFVWICPPEYIPGYFSVNNNLSVVKDQTVWIFKEVTDLGYVSGKSYALVNGQYTESFVTGHISPISGSWYFNFNNVKKNQTILGRGQFYYDDKTNKPWFQCQLNQQLGYVSSIGDTNIDIWTYYLHNAAAVPITSNDPFYFELPGSDQNGESLTSVPEFIIRCKNNS